MASDPDSPRGLPAMPTDISQSRSPPASLPFHSSSDMPLEQAHPIFESDLDLKENLASSQASRPRDASSMAVDNHPATPTFPISNPSTLSRDRSTSLSSAANAPLAQDNPRETESRSAPAPPPAAVSNGYRPLNVKDALSYLDQVKVMFSDKPEVYNRFLDIMKDFKSQAIDTPGVIERVSALFRGRPSLISGFNTFLPPGYRIECFTDEHARDIIKVTTPSGTTSTVGSEPLNIPPEMRPPHSPHYSSHSQHDRQAEAYEVDSRATAAEGGLLPPLHGGSFYHQQPPYQQQHSHHQHSYHHSRHHNHNPPHHASGQESHTSTTDENDRRPPVEFNHAINYVNKIKNHFVSDPDIYKQFLEILQTYQKEQKPIQDVYAQVTILFNGATDLLDEFKQFLPDVSAQPAEQNVFLGYGRNGSKDMSIMDAGQGRKKRPPAVQGAKRSKLQHALGSATSDIRSLTPFEEAIQPIISPDEVEFFERVKKHIGNKATYNAFLKILNLYSQQMVDQNVLVDRVEHFIGGNKELVQKFNTLVGFDGQDQIIENIPAETTRPDLSQCKAFGPSYRLVPKSWLAQSCSGRDDLCRQVLNDKYVSHPTWASEDSGFVASKKNQFEEALHRVEDERYDYDMNIEANLNTIALMEPIAKKISSLTDETEKTEYKLPVGLGGPSQTIYKRIIKKIYDKERGEEVVDMLHKNPVQSVPVVLKRLRQKDEEWKRAQRDWNKIWREIEAKNYYRALDYQGITFKGQDKRAMSTKTLIAEIEALHLEQMPESEDPAKGVVRETDPQLQYSFQDPRLFKDVTRLWYSFVTRQTTYAPEDCDAMRHIFKLCRRLLFDAPHSESDTLSDNDEDPGSDSDAASGSRSRSRRTSADRSRTSRHHHANEDTSMDIDGQEAMENGNARHTARSRVDLFGNSAFYCFLRLYQMVYARLRLFKRLSADYMSDPEKAKTANKAALNLDLASKRFHGIEIDLGRGYYRAMFHLLDSFFDGDMDQQVYEEAMRYIFGTKAFVMFTMDRLMLFLTRQLHCMASDPKAQKLMETFKKYSEREHHGPDALAAFRLEAEDIVGPDENVYHITFDCKARQLSMRLLSQDEKLFDPQSNEAYEEYMESYTDSSSHTRDIRQDMLSPVFLKRNVRQDTSADDMHVYSGMQYKICSNTYHMFYVVGSEDVFVRKPRRVRSKPTRDLTPSRRWAAWLKSKRQGT